MTDGITPTSTTATSNVQSAANQAASTAISSDFETFLRMMTAQLENQDPLNPIESADFAVQLATFSGVEQQVRTNQLLESLGNQMTRSSMVELAGFVGMEARAAVPVRFEGQPIDLSVSMDQGADEGSLIVIDSFNREVQRLPLSPGTTDVAWQGIAENGSAFPWGSYSFQVESRRAGEVLGTSGAEIYSIVQEARLENGQTQVILSGGQTVSADEITGLRNP